MKIEKFNNKIKHAVLEDTSIDPSLANHCKMLISFLDEIMDDTQIDHEIKFTRMTIIFEGFYRNLLEDSPLKSVFNQIRLNRWDKHCGTPTITFLLTYKTEIEQTQLLFNKDFSIDSLIHKPWDIVKEKSFVIDVKNEVVLKSEAKINVSMPLKEEKTGEFIKTHNPSGGFATTPCDPVSQKFIKYASQLAKQGGKILEIGAAFGAASLQVLEEGATVFCNDIDINNLGVIRQRHLDKMKAYRNSETGDDNQLVLLPGSFPEELAGLPKNFFDAILICRVLHFFTGDKIEKSLSQLSEYLKPGGKLFVVCETPFLNNWKKFIPEYEKRLDRGLKWPGEINNPAEYESSGRAVSLPKFVHWITKEILDRSLQKSKFRIEYLSYINRHGQFPSDLLLDERESVGAVAVKPR